MSGDTDARRDGPAANGAGDGAAPPTPSPGAGTTAALTLDTLRLHIPDQRGDGKPASAEGGDSTLTPAPGVPAGADAARTASSGAGTRPTVLPPSPSISRLLQRRGSFSERPIDVVRLACLTQRNELISLFTR